MPQVPIGCLEIDIPLSVLQKCQGLNTGQKLEMIGINRKRGQKVFKEHPGLTATVLPITRAGSKFVKPQDVKISAELDRSFLKLSMFTSTMGTLFRKKLTGTWNCEIKKTKIDKDPSNHTNDVDKARRKSSRFLSRSDEEVDEAVEPCTPEESVEETPSQFSVSDDGNSDAGDPDYTEEDLLPPNINPRVLLENIEDQLKAIHPKTEVPDTLVEATPVDHNDEDEVLAAMSSMGISMTEEIDPPNIDIKVEAGTSQLVEVDPMLLTTCPTCNKTYKSNLKLMAHIKRLHKGENLFSCSRCEEKFSTPVKLRIHLRNHKTVRCDLCGKGFANKERCILHIRTHTGEKPYICPYCGLTFARKATLYEHRRIHTNERPYVCTTCGKKFRRSTHLQRHNRVHSGERPFACNKCGRDFPTTSYLKIHMDIHDNFKKYVCQVCGKAFHAGNTLKRHMRIHTGEKPYTCSVCSKSFNQNNSLKSHMRIHTGEKPYVCSVCGEAFKQSCSLLTHSKRHQDKLKVDVNDQRNSMCPSGSDEVNQMYQIPVSNLNEEVNRAFRVPSTNEEAPQAYQLANVDGQGDHQIASVTGEVNQVNQDTNVNDEVSQAAYQIANVNEVNQVNVNYSSV